MLKLDARVEGTPIAKGSMSAFPIAGRCRITDQKAKQLKPWEAAIRAAASRAFNGEPLDGPVTVGVTFTFERPPSHLTSKGVPTKSAAPKIPKADIDKCTRAVLDALTGTWYVDDSQVVGLRVRKAWGCVAGASFNMWEVVE